MAVSGKATDTDNTSKKEGKDDTDVERVKKWNGISFGVLKTLHDYADTATAHGIRSQFLSTTL